jgi:transcriptional regulator GlxA family with amidase domain
VAGLPVNRRRFLLAAAAFVVAGCGSGRERRSVNTTDGTRIGLGVFEGVEELDFAGPYEVLTAWSRMSDDGVKVMTVAETEGPVQCAHGLRVLPDVTYADVGVLDVFLLPGGDSGPQLDDERFLERMRTYAKRGTLMTSVCTGALVFAKAGLLDGRPATTHWSSLSALGTLGTDVKVEPEKRFVDDGEVVTAAGVSAGIDMALHLVARLDSVARAREVRRYIQYDPQPPV